MQYIGVQQVADTVTCSLTDDRPTNDGGLLKYCMYIPCGCVKVPLWPTVYCQYFNMDYYHYHFRLRENLPYPYSTLTMRVKVNTTRSLHEYEVIETEKISWDVSNYVSNTIC